MIVLPLISLFEEIQRVTNPEPAVDAFELLYTYLKFPFYWTVGFIQVLILQLKNGKKKEGEGYDNTIDEIGNS